MKQDRIGASIPHYHRMVLPLTFLAAIREGLFWRGLQGVRFHPTP